MPIAPSIANRLAEHHRGFPERFAQQALGHNSKAVHRAYAKHAEVSVPSLDDCVQASGGWVNDSEPEAEFQETVNKSKAMLKPVALAERFPKASS